MPKTCTHPACTRNVWGKGYCDRHQYLRTDKKPKAKPAPVKIKVVFKSFRLTEIKKKPIRKVSLKLAKELWLYSKLRKEFLEKPENMFCAVFPHLLATEIHHIEGREGWRLNNTLKWLGVSRAGHLWIHANDRLARERGFLESRI